MHEFDYDLAVIGSGPAGHHAAIQGAKLRKRVLLVERNPCLGGICVNIGMIPSKTLREAILLPVRLPRAFNLWRFLVCCSACI